MMVRPRNVGSFLTSRPSSASPEPVGVVEERDRLVAGQVGSAS